MSLFDVCEIGSSCCDAARYMIRGVDGGRAQDEQTSKENYNSVHQQNGNKASNVREIQPCLSAMKE
jgi:hypothetical protein